MRAWGLCLQWSQGVELLVRDRRPETESLLSLKRLKEVDIYNLSRMQTINWVFQHAPYRPVNTPQVYVHVESVGFYKPRTEY